MEEGGKKMGIGKFKTASLEKNKHLGAFAASKSTATAASAKSDASIRTCVYALCVYVRMYCTRCRSHCRPLGC